MALQLTSPAFTSGDDIPPKYTADGQNTSPPLLISGIPEGTMTLALNVDDPDAATDPNGPGKVFDHWVVFNIPRGAHQFEENGLPDAAIQGRNGYGKSEYAGPNPPTGRHRYFFRLYALSTALNLDEAATKEDVLDAADPVILETAELMGTYQKGNIPTGG